MNAEREMSLDEVCAKLPSCHRANKELAKLKAAALSTPQARPDPLCVKALPECQFPKCGCKGEQARPDGGAVVARGVISEATDGWLDCVELTEAGAKLPPGEYQFYTHPAPAPDVALVGRFNELLQRMRGQLADSTADFAYPIVRDYCNELGDIFSALTAAQQAES